MAYVSSENQGVSISFEKYEVDLEKIKTIEDIKLLCQAIDLKITIDKTFCSEELLDEMKAKGLIKENEST